MYRKRPWNNPNTIGQIYRTGNDDLIICLKHTGDSHYSWGVLVWECVTQSGNFSLDVDEIVNYFNIESIFADYGVEENFKVLKKPLSKKKIIAALVAMGLPSTSGILIPLFPKEREEYLKNQLEERLKNERINTI